MVHKTARNCLFFCFKASNSIKACLLLQTMPTETRLKPLQISGVKSYPLDLALLNKC